MKKYLMIVVLVVSFLGTGSKEVNAEVFNYDRIGGEDRFEVAVNLSKKYWPESAEVVVLSNYNAFADALAAGPLAFKHNAPVLLTHPDKLTLTTKEELNRLSPSKVIIAGGTGSVSVQIEKELRGMGIKIIRYGGRDRFEVAVNIAKEFSSPKSAILANSQAFADALSVSPYASRNGIPILLTRPNKLGEETKHYIKESNIQHTYVIGGTGSVSNSVQQDLPSPTRIGGKDRYEVASKIFEQFNLDKNGAFIATGLTFADALTGSVPAAKENTAILLTKPNSLPESSLTAITRNNVSGFLLLGGQGSVGEEIEYQLFHRNSSTVPVVYFVPHADDEVLSYAVDIRNMIREGRPTYLVLMSQGEDSFARSIQNGFYDGKDVLPFEQGMPLFCHWHKRYHDPIEESYLHGHIDVETFGELREEDFFRATRALGVPEENIFSHALSKNEFTSENIEGIIKEYIGKYPSADFKTMSKFDGHIQHALIGSTLEEMEQKNELYPFQTSYFVSMYTDRFSSINIPYKNVVITLSNHLDESYIKKGINEYKLFEPENGLYGNGYHSVMSQFNALEKQMFTKIHK
ncbi:cell wall-binding repeat-containing protein [Bacillus sp. Marseille-Q1617]|uniref:cell wall-binding repeat-containing protein n=1 Tax=Bacillus sp. Marseille-Q1617 TaxID=2736887 RepID=UPI0015891316|nr:cell wall-binding repeat-containing protein [Bacillus sp. Marseille-Q1617]